MLPHYKAEDNMLFEHSAYNKYTVCGSPYVRNEECRLLGGYSFWFL
jgi:hypothetical protein